MKINNQRIVYKFETEEHLAIIKKEYEEKFKRLLAYVENHQEFPEFVKDPKISDNLGSNRSQYQYIPMMRYIFENDFFYEKNMQFISQVQINNDAQLEKKIFHSLLIHLDYQKENLVLPLRARYFNHHSEMIFNHLKNINAL